jgi:hypothetical protein
MSSRYRSPAPEAAALLKTGAGKIWSLYVYNSHATLTRYVWIFDALDGSDPTKAIAGPFPVPAKTGQAFGIFREEDLISLSFSTGCYIAGSTTDVTFNLATADLTINSFVQ